MELEYKYLSDEAIELTDKIVDIFIENGVKNADVRILGLELIESFSCYIGFNEHCCYEPKSPEEQSKELSKNEGYLKETMAKIFKMFTLRGTDGKLSLNNFSRERMMRERGIPFEEGCWPLREVVATTTDGYYFSGIRQLSHGIIEKHGLFLDSGTHAILESLFYLFERDGRDLDELLRDVYEYIKENEFKCEEYSWDGKPKVFKESKEQETRNKGKRWTEKEDKFIFNNYLKMTDKEMAKVLRRTEAAVKARRSMI